MSVDFRLSRRWAVAALFLGVLWSVASPAGARGAFVDEVLLGLGWPLRVDESGAASSRPVEKQVVARPSVILEEQRDVLATERGFVGAGTLTNAQDRMAVTREFLSPQPFFPGSVSWRGLGAKAVKVASLGAAVPVVARKSGSLMDPGEQLEPAGGLVEDPTGIFSSFVIDVDRSEHTVELFAIRNGHEKKLLFACYAGLGSAEYPTPSGKFFLVRIFDDRPLWIPPNSEWAWGQSPSHSVYGGHMLPLFKKVRPRTKGNGEEAIHDLDIIEPQMEMKDTEGYRVHGTDCPWSIGGNQSHGCVRLLNKSVKQLADLLKIYVGTTERGRTANGPYVTLARPVRINLH